MDRDTRRIQNTKQPSLEFTGKPSLNNMIEGQMAIQKKSNSQLAIYRKKFGQLWKSLMSSNGDQLVERNLKVKHSINVDRNIKVSGTTESLITANKLIISKGSNLTISSNSITPTHSFHSLVPQSGSSDNLDTINGGVNGQILILSRASGTITIRHDQDNIFTVGEADFAMNTSSDTAVLLYNGSWNLILAASID